MKALVLWSSRTGNTKAVGEAIYDALPCEKEIFESGRQPKDLSGYDLVYVERKSLSTARQAPIPTPLQR